MKNVYSSYKEKLRTPDEAVKVIKSGDWVDYIVCCTYARLV